MRFFKSITIPCTVTIDAIIGEAQPKGINLLACNTAAIEDLCQEERDYTGPESQTLLFALTASSEGLAAQHLLELKARLEFLSYTTVATTILAGVFSQRAHAHIHIETDDAFNAVDALMDRAANSLGDLEENGYALASHSSKHYVVSAGTQEELLALQTELATIEGVTLLKKVTCEACGHIFYEQEGYFHEGEYSYCSDCCKW